MRGEPPRAPYGRHAPVGSDLGTQTGDRAVGLSRGRREGEYRGESYYGQPAIKPSHYGWLIVCYFFIGGLAGAAQIIAAIADLTGARHDRPVVRAGRYLALAGALASPALLIADLRTPARWYNMLRIFRRTSAMSIGSWTLTAFGSLSGLAALGQALADVAGLPLGGVLARWAGLGGALAGGLMSVYTGALLVATAVPLWSSAGRLLPAWFGTSAVATATAALSLITESPGAANAAPRALDRLALMAGGAELALAVATDRVWRRRGTDAPLRNGRLGLAYRLGVFGLGIVAPLGLHIAALLAGRRARLGPIAAVATLVGGFLLRAVLIFGGNESGRRPQDYLRLSQPVAASVPAGRPARTRTGTTIRGQA